MPVFGPIKVLLQSRKGIVVLVALAFCTLVYFRDPSKLDKILQFLTVTVPMWLAAQGYEDGKKHEANGSGS
jgi:hypothetical protein